MGSNFAFMNELTIHSSLVQTNVQNFYEQAASAEKNITKDIWMALCNVREAAEYACRILVVHHNIPFKTAGLKGYVGRDNRFTKNIDVYMLANLRVISNKTTNANSENAVSAREAIELLYQVAKDLYYLLGGKGTINPLKLETIEESAIGKQTTIPTVEQLFCMIQEPVKTGIIKDGLDGGASKIGAMEQTINDILGILNQGDAKLVSKEQFESGLIKLEGAMNKQFELGKNDTIRRYQELEMKFDGIQSAMDKNSIQMDDLESKLTILLSQMDNIQIKQQNTMEYVAKIMESTDKIMESFVKINEQNLEAIGEGAKYILGEIKKASVSCADIFNHFTEEIKTTAKRYEESKRQEARNQNQVFNQRQKPLQKRTVKMPDWKLPGIEHVFRFAKNWSVTQRHTSYRLLYTMAVLMIAGWLAISYLGFTQEMYPLIPWKIGMFFWYLVTWSIEVLAKLCVGFTLVRIGCYGITLVHAKKKLRKKHVMKVVRKLIGAAMVLGLGMYIHQHFYEAARVYLGWKQTLLTDSMDIIQYYFREIFYNWGY